MDWDSQYQLVYYICKKLDTQEDIFNFLSSCTNLYRYFDYPCMKTYYDSLLYVVKIGNEIHKIKHFNYSMVSGKVAVIGDMNVYMKDYLYEKFFKYKPKPIVYDKLEYWDFITKTPIVWDHPFQNFTDFTKLQSMLAKNIDFYILDKPSIWFFISKYLKEFDYVFILNFNLEKDFRLFPEKNKILKPVAELLKNKYTYPNSHFILRSIVLNQSTAAVIDTKNDDLYFIHIDSDGIDYNY